MKMKNIFGIIAFIIAFALFRYLGFVGLIFIAVYFLGDRFSKWYIKRNQANEWGSLSLPKWIAWSNLITWLLPPLGILTATITYNFSTLINTKNKNKFKVLAIIGYALALMNALWGVMQRLSGS